MSAPARMLSFVALLLFAIGFGVMPGRTQGSPTEMATDVANDLVNRRFADVAARFSPDVAQKLTVPQLEQTWSMMVQQGGAVREVGTARLAQSANGVSLVIVPITLERLAVDLRLAIASDKIAGIFLAPPERMGQTAPTWSPPAYVDAAKFTSVEVTVGAAPTALGGTLTLPKTADPAAKVPAVVLIHGSGINDRDETIGPNRPFRDIAEGLATRGIAALRYDKRTKAHPEAFGGSFTVREEVLDDARAAVALLASRPEIDAGRIVIVGHSLGGTLAPRIADGDHDIAAVAILAGATRPLPTLFIEQAEYLASLHGPIDDTTRQRLDAIKAGAARALAAKASDGATKILGIPAAYWADLNAYDAAAAAAGLSLPLLILQGGRDYQVTAADLDRYKTALAGHSNVTMREFPRLNHLFMLSPGKGGPDDYRRLGHVAAPVIATLAMFVSGLPNQPQP
jgi:dienelactone hydrolase